MNYHLVLIFLSYFITGSQSFNVSNRNPLTPCLITKHLSADSTFLSAKQTKKKNKKRATRNTIGNRTKSASGFGGAAVSPCPCGSEDGYMKCCGLLHSNAKAYGDAKAEQVVRARYSAYAKREIDFIIGSTHPLNKDFMTDIQHWKEIIETNCYDNFELTKCQIMEETYEGEGEKEIAIVKFIATMVQVDTREKTAFMETSTFERAGKHIREGAWLYKNGVVEALPVDEEESEKNNDSAEAEEVDV
mmetsp:Transcript_13113/g.15973  ORF Transcript_13113/g.15973 Transcript_13113/m.15973 type:complete len:246 (-) Transcript_13113:115-852(-)